MARRKRTGGSIAGLVIGTLVAAGVLGGAHPAAADPGPPMQHRDYAAEKSIDVAIADVEYQRLLAEGREREGGRRKTPPTQTQAAHRPAEVEAATPHRAPLDIVAAQQMARQAAATHVSKPSAKATTTGGPTTTVAPAIGNQPNQAALNECMTDDANDEFGRVLNRFVYCKRFRTKADFYRIILGRRIHIGTTKFTYELFAQGDDQNRRIRTFARLQKDSVDYQWDSPFENLFVAPYIPLSLITNCAEGGDVCQATRGAVIMPFIAWDNNEDWFYWDVNNRENSAAGRDKLSYNRFYLQMHALGGISDPGQSEWRIMRCDSATYMKHGNTIYPYACIFAEVTPHLIYELASDYRSVALHIFTAQEHPNDTFPLLVPPDFPPPRDKRIPGKYDPGNASAKGLHRITEVLHPGQYKMNEDHKNGACYKKGDVADQYLDTGLPTPPDTSKQEECDEYPFASTLEGAAHPYWDFSVQAVPQKDNSIAGAELRVWYTNDRILAWDQDLPSPDITNDTFYVQIK
jgi:hypothetical protein